MNFEQSQTEEKKDLNDEKKVKIHFGGDRFNALFKSLTLATLVGIGSPMNSLAKNGNETSLLNDRVIQSERSNYTIEQLRSKIVQKLANLKKIANQKGKHELLHGAQARELIGENGNVITFSSENWLSIRTTNGITLVDKNSDGFIENVVKNLQDTNTKDIEDIKSHFALAAAFEDFDQLFAETEPFASDGIEGEVYKFSKEGEKITIEVLDMKTGEKDVLDGVKAQKIANEVTQIYLENLDLFQK